MMHRDFMLEMARVRRQEYEAEARRRRLCRLVGARERAARLSLRAKAARRLFDAAFAIEAEESWRAIWDRMSKPEKKHEEKIPLAENKRLAR